MPVITDCSRIEVHGVATVEDAELIAASLDGGATELDLKRATHIHSAVLQTVMAYRPTVLPPSSGTALAEAMLALGLFHMHSAAA